MKKNFLMSTALFVISTASLFAQIPENRKTDPANPPADTVYRNSSSDAERRLEKNKTDQKGSVESDNPTTPPRKNDEMMDKQKAAKRDSTMKARSRTNPQ